MMDTISSGKDDARHRVSFSEAHPTYAPDDMFESLRLTGPLSTRKAHVDRSDLFASTPSSSLAQFALQSPHFATGHMKKTRFAIPDSSLSRVQKRMREDEATDEFVGSVGVRGATWPIDHCGLCGAVVDSGSEMTLHILDDEHTECWHAFAGLHRGSRAAVPEPVSFTPHRDDTDTDLT
jgi:hypothetical protein